MAGAVDAPDPTHYCRPPTSCLPRGGVPLGIDPPRRQRIKHERARSRRGRSMWIVRHEKPHRLASLGIPSNLRKLQAAPASRRASFRRPTACRPIALQAMVVEFWALSCGNEEKRHTLAEPLRGGRLPRGRPCGRGCYGFDARDEDGSEVLSRDTGFSASCADQGPTKWHDN
jgi:hypothetical protein